MTGIPFQEIRTALVNHVLFGLGYNDSDDKKSKPGIPKLIKDYVSALGYQTRERGTTLGVLHPLSTIIPKSEDNSETIRSIHGRFLPQIPLSLSDECMFGNENTTTDVATSFEQDWHRIDDPINHFETVTAVFRKHAWSVPSIIVEEGLSLYEEFKMLSAIAHASHGNLHTSDYTLISGDFPGIQNILFTISSQGAAKSLRGRSLFLQLLADASVRLLLSERFLNLPSTNAVYVAGGNFLILAGPDAQPIVKSWQTEINATLLDIYHGDIALITGIETISLAELRGAGFQKARNKLAMQMGQAKFRQFHEIAFTQYDEIFSPNGASFQCDTCHRQPQTEADLMDIYDPNRDSNDNKWRCRECQAFEQLSFDIGRKPRFLSVGLQMPSKPKIWQELLCEISGFWYRFNAHAQQNETGSLQYKLNDTEFLESKADGFIFMASHTPLVSETDVRYLKYKYPEEPEQHLKMGDVRTFELLAENRMRSGISRLGILRMDIDSLGSIFHEWIAEPSIFKLSAASGAISIFFDGWLNTILRRIDDLYADTDDLYLIYAGGDDLFVVGAWDLLPNLAEMIHADLKRYVNPNPYITISAGITIESAKFPLYRAAEVAKHALDDRAKNYFHKDDHKKDAIDFLGQTVGWGLEWQQLRAYQSDLVSMLSLDDDEQPVASSILRSIGEAYQLFVANHKGNREQVYYGKHHWMLTYSLTRLANRHKSYSERIVRLQNSLLSSSNIRLSGAAARWASYTIRNPYDPSQSEVNDGQNL